jgi:hypothetical protein
MDTAQLALSRRHLLVLASPPLHAQTSWFSERQLQQPQFQKAFAPLDESAIVDEWFRADAARRIT